MTGQTGRSDRKLGQDRRMNGLSNRNAAAFVISWPRAENERVQCERTTGTRASSAIGNLPTSALCHLPDIEKADEGEEPTHKQLGPDVPMRQAPKSEEDQSRKKNSMFIVLREKVGESRVPGRHFLKKAGPSHPIHPKMGCRRHF
jgi:hypothetical protein